MRIAIVFTILSAALISACGPSGVARVYGLPALGQRLVPGIDLIFPATLRSNQTVDGRLVFTDSELIFDASPNEQSSQRWQFSSIRGIHRPNPNEIVVEPFDGAGYIFELRDPGLVNRDYNIVLGRLALARHLR